MPVTSVTTEPERLTLTIAVDIDAPLQRLWDVHVDPRQIERFWGPPTYPATFLRHDVFPGGRSDYWMTGPDDEIYRAYWEWESVDAPRSFVVADGFAHPDGTVDDEMPITRIQFSFSSTASGSRLVSTTSFPSAEALEQFLEMGIEEGTREAMGQIDAVVADLTSFAADMATGAQILSDTEVRVARIIGAPIDAVWHAYHDAEQIRRWMLGPDGWTMPVCWPATQVGDSFRYEWESEDDPGPATRFGFTGELLELDAPHRAVTTERVADTDGPSTLNELTLTELQDGTLLSLVITYPDIQLRDEVLATGMVDGIERSYQRLEELALGAA